MAPLPYVHSVLYICSFKNITHFSTMPFATTVKYWHCQKIFEGNLRWCPNVTLSVMTNVHCEMTSLHQCAERKPFHFAVQGFVFKTNPYVDSSSLIQAVHIEAGSSCSNWTLWLINDPPPPLDKRVIIATGWTSVRYETSCSACVSLAINSLLSTSFIASECEA